MDSICGINCDECRMKENCKGCAATQGKPFGGACVAAECIKRCGKCGYEAYKAKTISELNALNVLDMPKVTTLVELSGAFVNLEYPLPNGQKVKLLDDTRIYLGYQLEKGDTGRCFGLIADEQYLLVCEYGCEGAKPEILVYQKRK